MTQNLPGIDNDREGRKSAPAEPSAAPDVQPGTPSARGRDARGRYLPEHTENLTTAQYTDRLSPALSYIQGEVEQFNAGALADEGDDDIPTRRRSQLTYRTLLHRNILALAGALELRGLTDKRGKLRVAWIGKLESLINTAVRVDNLLTLQRHAKDLSAMSLEQYLNATRQETEPDQEKEPGR